MFRDRLPSQACLNPCKAHLFALDDAMPMDSYDYDDKMLVLIPIFQIAEGDESIEHHLCRAGAWARRSWLRNSDAASLGVQFAFYVDESEKDRILPILAMSGIDVERDVILFNGSDMEIEPVTRLGKKHSFFGDERFASYEWVFHVDVDMFLAAGSECEGGFPFFERMCNVPKEIGAVVAYTGCTEAIENRWWTNCVSFDEDALARSALWISRASMLAPPTVIDRYEYGDAVWGVHGGIYAYPASEFHTNRKEMVKWIIKAGRLLQQDEATFSIYPEIGEEIWSISQFMEIEFICEIGDRFEDYSRGTKYTLLHIGNGSWEYYWRKMIGASLPIDF